MLMKKKDVIKLSIPNKPEFVSVVRLTASSVASRMGFNIEEIEDIKVAIAEACTSVIKFESLQEDENNNIDIEFQLSKNELTIIVKGLSTGICKESLEKSHILDTEEANLGMFIIKSLMDDIECITDVNVTKLKMIKKIGVAVNGS